MRPNSHYVVVFLSTLPQGERHICSFSLAIARNFYPRSRKGSDYPNMLHVDAAILFYPRSPEGGNENCGRAIQWDNYFYPRSRKGSDQTNLE